MYEHGTYFGMNIFYPTFGKIKKKYPYIPFEIKIAFSITELSTAAVLFGSNPMIVELPRRLIFLFFAF